MRQEIILRDLGKPLTKRTEDEVRWICDSLGLIKGRDTEKISFKIIFSILKLLKKEGEVNISSEELSRILKINTPTINHHLRCLVDSGILIRERKRITLRGNNLSLTIEELQRDSEKIFEKILEVSRFVDKKLKLDSVLYSFKY